MRDPARSDLAGRAPALTPDVASRLARVALASLAVEYPSMQVHVLGSPDDLRSPREWHPAFFGSFDWHSSVHMHWTLARLARLVPGLPERASIVRVFDAHVTAETIASECAYFARPLSASFERTYGWAWLLELVRELRADGGGDARRWARTLAPLAELVAARWRTWLPRTQIPIRHGVHANSAFGLALALDYARAAGDGALESACVAKALSWFGEDADAPAAWEPSGADFLSPVLMEADLMRRVLPHERFGAWLGGFLPGLERGEPASLFTPAVPSDRSDPQIVHLDGLNLSRAWCLRGIANALARDDPRVSVLVASAHRHLAAGWAGLDSDDFVGTHWLASFALLALTES
ncbi:MAG: DUF2891 domain-containing protein [Burkholderiales bacterium]|nr:DUF2891 domain-containing protein [Burkholderiales bacterium]MCE7876087.1 DUF2891 domain-containing protein [Betaproteobacteria bacterium PRO3]